MPLAAKRLPGDEVVYVEVVPIGQSVRHPEARYGDGLVLAVHEASAEPVAVGSLLVVNARDELLSGPEATTELTHGRPPQLGLARCDLARLAHARAEAIASYEQLLRASVVSMIRPSATHAAP